MQILKNIRFLRIYAISLFFIPTIALVGSIFFHNYLVSFNYNTQYDYEFKENITGESVKFTCNKDNDYCTAIDRTLTKQKTLDQCYLNKIRVSIRDEKGSLYAIKNSNDTIPKTPFYSSEEFDLKLNGTQRNYILKNYNFVVDDVENNNKIIFKKFVISNQINEQCIRNFFEYRIYKIFPDLYEKYYAYLQTENRPPLGTANTVNPLIKGDTSISNIVKRFPIKYFFKPLIYLGSIIMIYYWFYNNRVLRTLKSTNKNFIFFKLGILSAIFLFLHTFFLGWTFENEILTKIRRTYIVFFILFEVLAQSFLLREIYSVKNKISQFANVSIIYLKMLFIILISSFTFIILIILINYNLDSKFDYILEWNYFLVLLIFYFLSFLLWKKPIK